ncbi:MAG: sugar ABC transporter ATP-binding protein [Spirochaetia bacterium]
MSNPTLRMVDIRKRFPGVDALKGVTFEAFAGEATALIGANGAGKSTLMNALGGVVAADSGEIYIDGQPSMIRSPADASRHGVAFVHQELALMPTLSILDNMLITAFPRRNGFIDYATGEKLCRDALSRLGFEFNLRTQVRDLSPGDQQIVEIARTLLGNSRIVIFDEPTSSLTSREKERLFEIIRIMKTHGTAIIYITHLLDEVFTVCERAVIMRNGAKVAESMIGDLTRNEIVEKMIGSQEVVRYFQRHKKAPGDVLLTVENLQREGFLENVSFSLRVGEVVGLWGLLGSGRTELFRALVGLDPVTGGRIHLHQGGKIIEMNPVNARKMVGLLTEDRRTDGLLLPMPIRNNMSLANLRNLLSRLRPFVARKREEKVTREYVTKLNIRSTSIEQRVATLSGGNQQKVVVGRWLQTKPHIFLLDEPTRGLDVEAKAELHAIIGDLADSGAAVLVVSSDLDEIMSLADRFLVMVRGRIVKELSGDASKRELLATASGIGIKAEGVE